MTKTELLEGLRSGNALEELLPLCAGQDCTIYKSEQFSTGDEIIYIPDMELNNITKTKSPHEEDADYTVNRCYSGEDFMDLCDGNEELAHRLWSYCDWQHPISALTEVEYEEE